MFFGGPPATVNPVGSASFVKTDTTTQGNWKTAYGADGFDLAQDPSANNPTIPAYATVNVTGASTYTWVPSTTDVRALQKTAVGSTDRVASTWYSGSSFSIDVHLNDAKTHQLALYALDWDPLNRNESITAIDDATGTVLDTRTVGAFSGGQYLVWNVTGNVTFVVKNTGNSNAVLSGLFFGGPPA